MTQSDRNAYWMQLSTSHVFVQHTVNGRRSCIVDIADELPASEANKLDTPAVSIGLVTGKVYLKGDQYRLRYTNELRFLSKFSILSENNPSIPASKAAAYDLTYEIMMDYLNKIQSDYEDDQCNGAFRFIDENSYYWEMIDIAGSNLCGWAFYFNDEEPATFTIDPSKWT